MQISDSKCVGCGNCTYVCPMGAIFIDPKTRKASINSDECVECYACYNGLSKEHLPPKTVRFTRRIMSKLLLRFEPDPDICPTDALVPDELSWPRVVRRAFSDPRVPHESTGVTGRGTEEVKTNDVSDRVAVGMVGITIEFGRPGVGARFHQIQVMSMKLAGMGVKIQPKNPVTAMMTDPEKGIIREDILNEKVLSAILEITIPIARLEEVIRAVWEVEKEIDTIVVLGVGTRCDENGDELVVAPVLEKLGYSLRRAKTNLGLGRTEIKLIGHNSKGAAAA
ncbi:4Fe-4S binding protein [Sphingomonas sp. AOB5]|uniref:4Fe-4S binding protein n=1 Tax=Sphingomonas sp. AOB5 TaxID=3034017 RepID=UPI0023F680B8|nr:4Fe-4S binding protein [Sphingomonas sp. AOB5]MDF7777641.1 4Fe-4S binding protein [Sphingomonas sp. AOB5]